MTSDKPILAIDLGTSGPKVALVTPSGDILAWEFEPVRLHLLQGGGAEQSAVEWWEAIGIAARRLTAATGVTRVAAVGATAQWSGTVAVGNDDRPLTNAIIWMDSRGAPDVHALVAGRPKVAGYGLAKLATWIRLTGGAPGLAGKDSLAHILYLRRSHPDVYRSASVFLEPKDYINLRLTGVRAASFDSITLHWLTDNRAIDRVAYAQQLLTLTGIERVKLPDLRRATDILGPLTPEAAGHLGIEPGAPVAVGSSDIHSAAIGAGAVRDYDANLYVGTSSWFVCHVPFKRTDLFHNMASLPSAIPGKYLLTNEQECAGACLTFLRDNLLFADDELATPLPDGFYAALNRMAAREAPGSGGLIFTPWLYGERTPVEDHTLRGGFHNLSLTTSRAQIARAVMEGVAYNMRWLRDAVRRFLRRSPGAVIMTGGGAQSAVWCQIFADVLGCPIHQATHPLLANVRGAALIAAVAIGSQSFNRIQAPVAATFHPRREHRRIYDELFRVFVRIYRQNRDIYAHLNRR
ncbi:xylulokinase [Roseiflexus castenholzii]|jgi:xylulokinase|uniref:Carbohydrate kinase FGGY n=1 Tax=Roseiflexus castenholzii (strain DSM 13941 / HLO8) TaxID=383372 RepID=A7NKD7_ROSCS|nr:FGGY-family carbohydrate kinase [Roseiflexus castenholzii]ABU57957.1 carbohydrate kinase FGGY [Roseiflexus castenholzii DSM 13941]